MRICIGILFLFRLGFVSNILDFVTCLSITFDVQLDVASESANSYKSVSEMYVYGFGYSMVGGPFRRCEIFRDASCGIPESSDNVGIVWIVFIPRVLDGVCTEICRGAFGRFLIAETAVHTGLARAISRKERRITVARITK